MHIDFAPSAGRHGISQDRIRHVISHCRSPLYPPDDDQGDKDLVMFLGPDATGVPLEVVAIENEDGLYVIHAMRLRPRYADDYTRVMGS